MKYYYFDLRFSDVNAGVSENCMLGHLVPQGTGSFDLLLNHVMLRDAHEMSEFLRAPVQSNLYVEPNAANVAVQGQVAAISPRSDFIQEAVWSPSSSALSPGQYFSNSFHFLTLRFIVLKWSHC